ncbi:YybH family protein [Desertihabitans aurantiacus]|uniref:YybH family protein n=1 Tax=Desertihabitans aurantiacus TaxID=2282477 RepID=UPI00130034E6|nr:SgcJ/EcaC family oxidoreductase [Desertihabitans aurantiacus]
MTTDATTELEQLVRERAEAVRRQDEDALLRREHPDVLSFPVLPPAVSRGREGTAQAMRAWFDSYAEGPGYEVHEVWVEAEGDLGCVSFHYHVTGTLHTGGEVDMWVRVTLVCRRTDGTWQVVHAHESVPFDPATGQALLSEGPNTV